MPYELRKVQIPTIMRAPITFYIMSSNVIGFFYSFSAFCLCSIIGLASRGCSLSHLAYSSCFLFSSSFYCRSASFLASLSAFYILCSSSYYLFISASLYAFSSAVYLHDSLNSSYFLYSAHLLSNSSRFFLSSSYYLLYYSSCCYLCYSSISSRSRNTLLRLSSFCIFSCSFFHYLSLASILFSSYCLLRHSSSSFFLYRSLLSVNDSTPSSYIYLNDLSLSATIFHVKNSWPLISSSNLIIFSYAFLILRNFSVACFFVILCLFKCTMSGWYVFARSRYWFFTPGTSMS